MKIVHLSDLLLGKRVNEFSMLEDQQFILLRIISVIDREKPDAVLIAGDLFDCGYVSPDTVGAVRDALEQLLARPLLGGALVCALLRQLRIVEAVEPSVRETQIPDRIGSSA